MKRSLVVAVVALALLQRPALLGAAVSDLVISETCVSGTRLEVNFGWRGSEPAAVQQWLDLSLEDNGWQPGTYISAGPFAPDRGSYAWSNPPQDTTHYVRVNQQLPDGSWDPSKTYYFTTAECFRIPQ